MPPTDKGSVQLKGGRATIDMGTMKQAGFLDLRLRATVDGQPTDEEGRFMISCRVLYRDPIERDKYLDKSIDDQFSLGDNRSVMYVGEIESAWKL